MQRDGPLRRNVDSHNSTLSQQRPQLSSYPSLRTRRWQLQLLEYAYVFGCIAGRTICEPTAARPARYGTPLASQALASHLQDACCHVLVFARSANYNSAE